MPASPRRVACRLRDDVTGQLNRTRTASEDRLPFRSNFNLACRPKFQISEHSELGLAPTHILDQRWHQIASTKLATREVTVALPHLL